MPDPKPDPRFPVPDRTIKPGATEEKSKYFREINIGHGSWIMADGRPAMFENWLDCDAQTFCRTVYYSTLDAENWDCDRHYNFVKESGLLKDKTYPGDSVGLVQIEDKAGRLWWSVTIGIRDDED